MWEHRIIFNLPWRIFYNTYHQSVYPFLFSHVGRAEMTSRKDGDRVFDVEIEILGRDGPVCRHLPVLLLRYYVGRSLPASGRFGVDCFRRPSCFLNSPFGRAYRGGVRGNHVAFGAGSGFFVFVRCRNRIFRAFLERTP